MTGGPSYPAAKAITVTPLEGAWSRLESFPCEGYGLVTTWHATRWFRLSPPPGYSW